MQNINVTHVVHKVQDGEIVDTQPAASEKEAKEWADAISLVRGRAVIQEVC
jgi:hypothetical protein